MSTPYSDIYNVFLENVSDSDLLVFSEEDREKILYGFMDRACNNFQYVCKKVSNIDLFDRDELLKQFNATLDSQIINIIVTGMVVEWLKPKYFYNENMKNILNTSDYNMAASPANMANSIRTTYLTTKQEFESMIRQYSYEHSNIERLRH